MANRSKHYYFYSVIAEEGQLHFFYETTGPVARGDLISHDKKIYRVEDILYKFPKTYLICKPDSTTFNPDALPRTP